MLWTDVIISLRTEQIPRQAGIKIFRQVIPVSQDKLTGMNLEVQGLSPLSLHDDTTGWRPIGLSTDPPVIQWTGFICSKPTTLAHRGSLLKSGAVAVWAVEGSIKAPFGDTLSSSST